MEDCSNDLANSVPEEKRADNSNDDQKYSEKNCSNCKDANVDLFTCDSCANDDKSGENGDFPKFFCSWCVIRCTKVGHKIRNLKGQEPLVCSEHKIVKTEYCQTCDVPFCFKCLTDHGKHEFSSLESRANSLKTKVFEFLSELEAAEKPIRMQGDELKEKIDEHQIGQNELRNYLLKEWEQAKAELVKKVEENRQIRSEDLAKMELLINDTVDQQRNLRRLLSMSNANLIQNFPAVEEKFLKAQKELTEMTSVTRDLKSVKNSEMAKLFDHFKREMLTKMESKVDYSSATNFEPCFVCSDDFDFVFRVSFDGKCLEVQQSDYIDNDERTCDSTKSVPFDNVPTKIFPVHDNSFMSLRILVLTNNLEAWLIDPRSLELKKVPYPPNSHFLWPYRVNWEDEDDVFYWSYWDESAKVIRFTHSDTLCIPCETLPFIKMSSSVSYSLCFVIAQHVVLVDVKDEEFEQIPIQFGSDVSCISNDLTSEYEVLFLWSRKDKFVQPWSKTDGKWQAGDKIYWNDEDKIYSASVNDHLFKLLPLVKNSDDDAIIEIFAIKNVDE